MEEEIKFSMSQWFTLFAWNMGAAVVWFLFLLLISFLITHEMSEQIILTLAVGVVGFVLYIQLFNLLLLKLDLVGKNLPSFLAVTLLCVLFFSDYVTLIASAGQVLLNYILTLIYFKGIAKKNVS